MILNEHQDLKSSTSAKTSYQRNKTLSWNFQDKKLYPQTGADPLKESWKLITLLLLPFTIMKPKCFSSISKGTMHNDHLWGTVNDREAMQIHVTTSCRSVVSHQSSVHCQALHRASGWRPPAELVHKQLIRQSPPFSFNSPPIKKYTLCWPHQIPHSGISLFCDQPLQAFVQQMAQT